MDKYVKIVQSVVNPGGKYASATSNLSSRLSSMASSNNSNSEAESDENMGTAGEAKRGREELYHEDSENVYARRSKTKDQEERPATRIKANETGHKSTAAASSNDRNGYSDKVWSNNADGKSNERTSYREQIRREHQKKTQENNDYRKGKGKGKNDEYQGNYRSREEILMEEFEDEQMLRKTLANLVIDHEHQSEQLRQLVKNTFFIMIIDSKTLITILDETRKTWMNNIIPGKPHPHGDLDQLMFRVIIVTIRTRMNEKDDGFQTLEKLLDDNANVIQHMKAVGKRGIKRGPPKNAPWVFQFSMRTDSPEHIALRTEFLCNTNFLGQFGIKIATDRQPQRREESFLNSLGRNKKKKTSFFFKL